MRTARCLLLLALVLVSASVLSGCLRRQRIADAFNRLAVIDTEWANEYGASAEVADRTKATDKAIGLAGEVPLRKCPDDFRTAFGAVVDNWKGLKAALEKGDAAAAKEGAAKSEALFDELYRMAEKYGCRADR